MSKVSHVESEFKVALGRASALASAADSAGTAGEKRAKLLACGEQLEASVGLLRYVVGDLKGGK